MAHEKIKGCIILKDLHYSVKDNTWIRADGDIVTIGMTDIAQGLAGPILHAKTKKPGTIRKKGRPIATVESGKWVGPVKSPVSGEIIEVNENLVADAQLINRSPYKDGWVVKMKTTNLEAEMSEMTTGDAAVEAYREKIEQDGIECKHIDDSDTYD
ncbi:MAG: glycine cleavage system protein GcvH [Candidatus Marinimicrobia bacterium]|nr:glycine cleavage system protein GcvH [Candidatus Neomarinimicrobiota bacterium]